MSVPPHSNMPTEYSARLWLLIADFNHLITYLPLLCLSTAPKRSGTHSIAFSDKTDKKYGLKITARHPNWSNVASVAWKFCVAFGCEDNTGEKPKRSTNVK